MTQLAGKKQSLHSLWSVEGILNAPYPSTTDFHTSQNIFSFLELYQLSLVYFIFENLILQLFRIIIISIRRWGYSILQLINVKQTPLIRRYLTLKESRISVWRNFVKDLYIDLVQIAFSQQSVLQSIFFVTESNIWNKTSITLSSGLYENKK